MLSLRSSFCRPTDPILQLILAAQSAGDLQNVTIPLEYPTEDTALVCPCYKVATINLQAHSICVLHKYE